MRESPDMKFTAIAQIIICMLGPAPLDVCREIEIDMDGLASYVERVIFNQSRVRADFTLGLDVSPYFVNSNPGYYGTYLN